MFSLENPRETISQRFKDGSEDKHEFRLTEMDIIQIQVRHQAIDFKMPLISNPCSMDSRKTKSYTSFANICKNRIIAPNIQKNKYTSLNNADSLRIDVNDDSYDTIIPVNQISLLFIKQSCRWISWRQLVGCREISFLPFIFAAELFLTLNCLELSRTIEK